jgi:transposase-like protein
LSSLRLGRAVVVGYLRSMTTSRDPLYAGYRSPAELISYAVWLYFRFPLSLRMVEEMLAARGISVTYETIRQWGLKFGQEFANRHRQLVVDGKANAQRIERGSFGRRDYAAIATPVTSAQVVNASLRAVRNLAAVSWLARREKTLAI